MSFTLCSNQLYLQVITTFTFILLLLITSQIVFILILILIIIIIVIIIILPGEGGEGRIGTATMLRIVLPMYAFFSTVLSKILALISYNRRT